MVLRLLAMRQGSRRRRSWGRQPTNIVPELRIRRPIDHSTNLVRFPTGVNSGRTLADTGPPTDLSSSTFNLRDLSINRSLVSMVPIRHQHSSLHRKHSLRYVRNEHNHSLVGKKTGKHEASSLSPAVVLYSEL